MGLVGLQGLFGFGLWIMSVYLFDFMFDVFVCCYLCVGSGCLVYLLCYLILLLLVELCSCCNWSGLLLVILLIGCLFPIGFADWRFLLFGCFDLVWFEYGLYLVYCLGLVWLIVNCLICCLVF